MTPPSKPKYLTKSRFKVAYECASKLFYNEHPETFGNNNRENEFLQALAQGGFQVGALAKVYYPNGTDLEDLGTEDAIAETEKLLKKENVTIFEAALRAGPFLVRVDVLEKSGNEISLIEVKSSTFDFSDPEGTFFKKRDPGIDSGWEPYLVDVAFQTWVARTYCPDWSVTPFLMLADKSSKATVDGLHQNFRIEQLPNGRSRVVVRPGVTLASVGQPILKAAKVFREVDYLLNTELFPNGDNLSSYAHALAEYLTADERGPSRISSLCKGCEFRIPAEEKNKGKQSGFEKCWLEAGKLKQQDLTRPLIFEIWNCRKTPDLLAENKLFFDQVSEDDLKPKSKSKKPKSLEPYQRQMIQIQKRLANDPTPYVDRAGLADLIQSVAFPLHCIDFETTMVAIPFHTGRRPYEQIAFQFSHHVLHENGKIEHVDQFLDMNRGSFPNFEFVRRLRNSLSKDRGSIFRYATHENTVLRQIRQQLVDNPQPDQDALLSFIDEITKPRGGEAGNEGRRNMLDLREIVLEHYYHPLMGGSNSIKKVIPAVLEESGFLKKKYSSAIYGIGKEIPSLNFGDITWIELDSSGRVKDPYKRLPPVFRDIPQDVFSEDAPLFHDESIDDGGAAMTAWSRMQFTEMKDEERDAIQSALLKYCELDTLSMVWLLEYWRQIV